MKNVYKTKILSYDVVGSPPFDISTVKFLYPRGVIDKVLIVDDFENKKKEGRQIISDIDPFGEEIWYD